MKIGIVTGSRAEWGLLFPLAREIAQHPDCKLEVFVTGSHFSPAHGNTWKVVVDEYDSLHSDDQHYTHCPHLIDTQMASDTPASVCKTIGLTIDGVAGALAVWKPDCLVVLGDRYESFAAATAAHVVRIPVVHIHGGEVTHGAIDDGFRHSITKMSSLHLVAAEPYRRRVIQMGEDPATVFTCGALGVEGLDRIRARSKMDRRKVVVAYHPVTHEPDNGIGTLQQLLHELWPLRQQHDFLVFGANADTGNAEVNAELKNFAAATAPTSVFYSSLSRPEFLNHLATAAFIIGNSSAGINEAPALGVPTINIGSRQQGRLMAGSVFQANDAEEIRWHYYMPKARLDPEQLYCPYGRGGAVAKGMFDTILQNKEALQWRKKFYDLR